MTLIYQNKEYIWILLQNREQRTKYNLPTKEILLQIARTVSTAPILTISSSPTAPSFPTSSTSP